MIELMKKYVFLGLLACSVLVAGCSTSVPAATTETMSFDQTYAVFVQSIMSDQIDQLTAVSSWGVVETNSAVSVGMDNDFARADIVLNSASLMSGSYASGSNALSVFLDSDLLQLSGSAIISYASQLLDSYYRLDGFSLNIGGLLAGDVSYIDILTEQIASLEGQWYALSAGELLGTDTTSAANLSESLVALPQDVSAALLGQSIFEELSAKPTGYAVDISTSGAVLFVEALSENDYFGALLSGMGSGDTLIDEDFESDIAALNEATDMFLRIDAEDEVTLVVSSVSGAMAAFDAEISADGIVMNITDTQEGSALSFSWVKKMAGLYDVSLSLSQGEDTIATVAGTHDMQISDASMKTVIDLVVSVSTSYINVPLESDFIDITLLIESSTQDYDEEVLFEVPSDVQEFDAFLGGLAGGYVEPIGGADIVIE